MLATSSSTSNDDPCHQSDCCERIRPIPRLVLLDRDGVINHDVGAPGVLQPSQLRLTRNAAQAIKNFRQHGCKIAIITNQSCVGKGLISKIDLSRIHDTLLELLKNDDEEAIVDHIFYSTSLRNSGDYRMKPNPGMINEACEMFGIQAVDCVMIGDALRDLEAAASAGVDRRVLVETGYGLGIMNNVKAPLVLDDEKNESQALLVNEKYCLENGKMIGFPENYGKNSILPFHYIADLYAASSWILQNRSN